MLKKFLHCCLFTFIFITQVHAQVGIGTATPDASAALDVTSTSKGLLAPRVSLTDVTVAAPVTTPAEGLLVYSNTAPTGGNGRGYYYWSGASGTPANNWVAVKPATAATNFWSLLGNAGTTPGTNFIGTTDAQDWVVKTTGLERLRVLAGGNVGIGIAAPTSNLHILNAGTGGTGVTPGNTANTGLILENLTNGNSIIQRLHAKNGAGADKQGIWGINPGAANLGGTANGVILFSHDGSNDLLIDAVNGNVGIGSLADATAKLTVGGQARVITLPAGNPSTDQIVSADANGNLRQLAAVKPAALVVGITGTLPFAATRGAAGTSVVMPGAVIVNSIPGASYTAAGSLVSLPAGTYQVTLVLDAVLISSTGPNPAISSYFYDFSNGASGAQRIHSNSPSIVGGNGIHGVTIEFTVVIPATRTYTFALGWGVGGNVSTGGTLDIYGGTQLSFVKLN